jgi:hypothetical protein
MEKIGPIIILAQDIYSGHGDRQEPSGRGLVWHGYHITTGPQLAGKGSSSNWA